MNQIDKNLFDMPIGGGNEVSGAKDGTRQDKAPSPESTEPAPTLEQLREELSRQRKVLLLLVISALLFGSSFGFFMLRQTVMLNRQRVEQARMLADFRTNVLPRVEILLSALRNFASTNPEFAQILDRHVKFTPVTPTNRVPQRPGQQTVPQAAPASPTQVPAR